MDQNGLMYRRCLHFLAAFTLSIAALWIFLPATAAHASVYGRGKFGDCTYTKCTATTVITTPANLEVAINLSDGQTIPAAGYAITITPLNGAGTTFKEVRVYIGGTLAATVPPDTDGTARWFWNPATYPGTHIAFEIVDTSNNITKKSFDVLIGAAAQSGGSTSAQDNTGTPPEKSANPLVSFLPAVIDAIGRSYHKLQKVVSDLPQPVVESFPYFLFIFLAINILLLILQLRREVRESQTLQAILKRAALLEEQKETFTALISHYLRTPLSILNGGIELLQGSKTAGDHMAALKAAAANIRKAIDDLLARTAQPIGQAVIGSQTNIRRPFWQQVRFFLPLLLIGLALVSFNVLALSVNKFSHAGIQLSAQIIIFSAIALIIFQLFRRMYLRKSDKAMLEYLVGQADAAAANHDAIMAQAARTLIPNVQVLREISEQVSKPSDSNYIAQAVSQFDATLAQLRTAVELKGTHASHTPLAITVSTALQEARALLKQPNANIELAHDMTLSVPNPELLVRALADVLDNAIAYSPPKAKITVTAKPLATSIEIAVQDQGNGIPIQKMPLIFQPFYKAEGTQTFTHEGMGFSLYLDKIIMTYLGGDISIDSVPNQGTTARLQVGRS